MAMHDVICCSATTTKARLDVVELIVGVALLSWDYKTFFVFQTWKRDHFSQILFALFKCAPCPVTKFSKSLIWKITMTTLSRQSRTWFYLKMWRFDCKLRSRSTKKRRL